jgi:hypothetical protein
MIDFSGNMTEEVRQRAIGFATSEDFQVGLIKTLLDMYAMFGRASISRSTQTTTPLSGMAYYIPFLVGMGYAIASNENVVPGIEDYVLTQEGRAVAQKNVEEQADREYRSEICTEPKPGIANGGGGGTCEPTSTCCKSCNGNNCHSRK